MPIESAKAQTLVTRLMAGEDLSDEEVDALADYLADQDVSEIPEIKEDSERGRHLRLALQFYGLLNELFPDQG